MSLDFETRKLKADLLRQVKALEGPDRAEQRKARREARKSREKALVRTEEQRQPRVRDNAYLAFIRRQPCLHCGSSPVDAAHIRFAPPGSGWRYVGKAEKPDDARCVPLCRAAHELQHSMREADFWASVLNRDPVETCAELRQQFGALAPREAKP